MERLEFIRSRGRNALMLLTGPFLIAACLLLALDPTLDVVKRAIGWFGTLFFGLASLVGLVKTIRGGTVFSFASEGITDHANSITIPWNEIEACVVVSVHGSNFLGLVLQDRDRFLTRLSMPKRILARLDERMGCGQWALSFADVSPGIDAALKFIRRHAPSIHTPAF
jgi:hypothetical protein